MAFQNRRPQIQQDTLGGVSTLVSNALQYLIGKCLVLLWAMGTFHMEIKPSQWREPLRPQSRIANHGNGEGQILPLPSGVQLRTYERQKGVQATHSLYDAALLWNVS